MLAERLPFIWFHAENKSLRFAFSTANTGTDISQRPEIKDADIINLHWTNFGFLSVDDIALLLETGKPVVWTLHDMWAFTGGCHYAGDCDHFKNQCGDCWMLRDPAESDLSHRGWLNKLAMYKHARNLTFVTCSRWLAEVARTNSLIKDFRIEAIPNPIDTEVFSPKEKAALRGKWNIGQSAKVILFGAANILDRRKGFGYLLAALQKLKESNEAQHIVVVIFGKNKSFDISEIPFKTHQLNIITSEADMAEVYNLADVFVNPTIEDNLPNTVMESLSCGVPVVAFNTGGVPDMVDHRENGYLAEYKSPDDLAQGIGFVLHSGNYAELSEKARKKVLQNFTGDIVASKYTDLYHSLLKR
jgi:glycosyltransferase involved in cell wall biosynthesis